MPKPSLIEPVKKKLGQTEALISEESIGRAKSSESPAPIETEQSEGVKEVNKN